MGWGICFGLNEQNRVYCVDGCNWKATAADYADYPSWPSASSSVLDYFEGEAHRELDMIRDETPGTAAALKEACEEHISYALSLYDRLSDAEKIKRHEEMMEELTSDLETLKRSIPDALETHRHIKSVWTEFKKSAPQRKRKAARTREEEIEREMEPLKLELEVERAAARVDALRKRKAGVTRMLKLEKSFQI